MMRSLRTFAGLATVALCACTVTDTGNPPIDIDPARIDNDTSSTGAPTLRGLPGAVSPAEGIVRLTPLGSMDVAATATVQPDGSFNSVVAIEGGGLVRLQVIQGVRRSEPVDVSGSGAVAPSPSCLVIPGWESAVLDDTTESEFELIATNECADTVEFGDPVMRLASGPLTLLSSPPAPLAPGESRALRLRVERAGPGEEVVLLPLTAPSATIRAITLVVAAP